MPTPTEDPIFGITPLDKHERRALRALGTGTATEAQQKMASAVIVKKIARYGDTTFIAGSPDGSAFLAGRAFVGASLRRILTEPIPDDGDGA